MSESIVKHAVVTAGILTVFTVVFTALLAYTNSTTKAPIAATEAAARMALFRQILPEELHDNDMLHDAVKVPAGGDLANREDTMMYRARLQGSPSALILETTAPDGYSGDIKLLLAIKANGELAGVRVIAHKETPGLGDYIDITHSDWIKGFNGKSLANPDEEGWHVKKDGGKFDYVTGATITPRAVVKAVHNALNYASKHQQEIFAAAAIKEEKQ